MLFRSVLALPAGAPWMKLSEGVDFLRAVKPRLAFPIHEAVVAEAARGIFFGLYENLAPKETEFRQFSQENSLTL